jgi:hypothetical protein
LNFVEFSLARGKRWLFLASALKFRRKSAKKVPENWLGFFEGNPKEFEKLFLFTELKTHNRT